jgi:hypothetical protein
VVLDNVPAAFAIHSDACAGTCGVVKNEELLVLVLANIADVAL